MQLFASEIVADARSIELELFRSADERRRHLIEWFNGHVEAGGLGDVDPLTENTNEKMAAMMIEEVVHRPVLLSEVYV